MPKRSIQDLRRRGVPWVAGFHPAVGWIPFEMAEAALAGEI